MGIHSAMDNKNKALVAAWAQAWSSADEDRLLALFTDDCVYEEVPTGLINRGKEEVRAFAQALWKSIAGLRMIPKRIMASDDAATVEWTMTGRPQREFPGWPNTGPAIRVRGMSMFVFKQGKIERVSDYWDLTTSGIVPLVAVD